MIEDDILTVYDLYSALQSILKAHLKDINIKLNTKTVSGEVKEKLIAIKTEIEAVRETLKDFDIEIIKVRNTIAHVKEKTKSTGELMLESINKDGTTIVFNEESCVDLRVKINNHGENLSKIKEYFEAISVVDLAAYTAEKDIITSVHNLISR